MGFVKALYTKPSSKSPQCPYVQTPPRCRAALFRSLLAGAGEQGDKTSAEADMESASQPSAGRRLSAPHPSTTTRTGMAD
jgi:hypothetical protein